MKKALWHLIILTSVILLFTLLLLYKANFFHEYKDSTFNNIVTPIATSFAAIIYTYTLIILIRTNNLQSQSALYPIFCERLLACKNTLQEKILYNTDPNDKKVTALSFYHFFKDRFEKINIYANKHSESIEDYLKVNKKLPEELNSLCGDLFSLTFDITLNYSAIEQLCFEIFDANLSKHYQTSINTLIINILNDYLLVCKIKSEYRYNSEYFIRNNGEKINFGWLQTPIYNPIKDKVTELNEFHKFDGLYHFLESKGVLKKYSEG